MWWTPIKYPSTKYAAKRIQPTSSPKYFLVLGAHGCNKWLGNNEDWPSWWTGSWWQGIFGEVKDNRTILADKARSFQNTLGLNHKKTKSLFEGECWRKDLLYYKADDQPCVLFHRFGAGTGILHRDAITVQVQVDTPTICVDYGPGLNYFSVNYYSRGPDAMGLMDYEDVYLLSEFMEMAEMPCDGLLPS
jgi:hypothetical protein